MSADTIDIRESFRLSRDMARARMPHLYRVARLFPEQERFDAFCALYASMRWVDDRVDEKQTDLGGLDAWEREIDTAFSGGAPASPFGPALADTLSRFSLKPEPWHRLLSAMRYDLQHDGFATYEGFIRYAEGATVAPAMAAAAALEQEGICVTVASARFAKPVDAECLAHLVKAQPWVLTLEDHSAAGGFGSAVLETAEARGLDARKIHRVGIGERRVEHDTRAAQLAAAGLDADGIAARVKALAGNA